MGLWGWIYFAALVAASGPALVSDGGHVRRLAWVMLANWAITRIAVTTGTPHEVMATGDMMAGAAAVIVGGGPGLAIGLIFFAMPIATWAMETAPMDVWLAVLDLGGFAQLAILGGASDGGRRVMGRWGDGARRAGVAGHRVVLASISGLQAVARKVVR